METKEIAEFLLALISARGLTIPAASAETYIESKRWLEGIINAPKIKEVRVPGGQDGGISGVTGTSILANGGAPMDSKPGP